MKVSIENRLLALERRPQQQAHNPLIILKDGMTLDEYMVEHPEYTPSRGSPQLIVKINQPYYET